MELRPGRAFLVVADAGIDQNGVAAGPHDKAVKAENQLAGARFEEARAEQVRVFGNHGGVEIRKELRRVEKGTLVVGDAVHFETADADGLHLSSLGELWIGRSSLDCSAPPSALPSGIGVRDHCSAGAGPIRSPGAIP